MQKVKLANVLLEPGMRMDFHPDLYVRSASPILTSNESSFAARLMPYAKYDFATYFNACSCGKFKQYTHARRFLLHLELKGKGEIRFETISRAALSTARTLVGRIEFEHDDFREIEFEFPDTDDALLAFEMVTFEMCDIRDSYYYTYVAPEKITSTRLSVAMTTFNNESYVIPNIELFRKELLSSNDEVGHNLTVHVVDNGRSLDAQQLAGGGIFIHPNPNVGGSGGFARGMIESLHQENKPTHVLLMDDDVSISPESIRRTFTLLSIRNEAYRDAFVSGAMLKLEKPNMQFEDVAYVRNNALYDRIKPDLDMEDLSDVVLNEMVDVEKRNAYCAWWYCCIPVETIEKHGLPLPLFVRCDDVEYGMRCQPAIMAMGGICVWHSAFGSRFKPSIDLYQYTRNFLIATASIDPSIQEVFMNRIKDNVQLQLKKLDYNSADLILDALDDYLKGPDFIKQASGERIIKQNMAKNETLVPILELDYEGIEDVVVTSENIKEHGGERSLFERFVDFTTCNGHRLPYLLLKDELVAVPAGGFEYPAKRMRMHKALLAVDPEGRLGSVRLMDKKRFRQVMRRYKRCLREYGAKNDSLLEEYAHDANEFREERFWRQFLGMI